MSALVRVRRVLIGFFLGAVCAVIVAFFYFLYTPRPALPPLSASAQRRSARLGSLTRTYLVYAPARLKPGAPLIFVFHGSTQSGEGIRWITGYAFDRLADRHGFVVVYPDGYKGNWNDCRKAATYPARALNVDDEGFVRAMIAALQRDHGINPKRVFATGHSNGGHYAFRLALEQPEEVAGIAAISASLPTADNTVCQAAGKEIPVMIINGTSDPMNPYEGGKVAMWGLLASRGTVTSSEASAAYFAGLGGALAAPQVERLPQVDPSDASRVERKTWRSARGIEVVLLSVHGGGHVVPQPYCRYPRLMGHQTRNLDAPLEICRFFGVL